MHMDFLCMRKGFYLRLCVAFLLLGAIPMLAQTSFGRISGTVTDQSDAAVAGVTITVRDLGTGAARTATTDANGFYVVTNLLVGDYAVEASKTGFKAPTRSGLHVVADGRITVDFRLEIGDVHQTVEVVSAPMEMLNTVSGEISRSIDSKQVANLTMNGRNYLQLMTLVPGAVVTNPDQFSVTTSLASNNQTINGNRPDSNNLTVDGAYNQVAGSNASLMNNVSPDFVQEVKLQTSNFSAEWGRMSGPAFNIVTKSGTNQFHGGAVEFFRNDKLDARSFFAPYKTQLRFNNFGYHLGGPIKKDKLFFFFGEEWKKLRQQQTAQRFTVPSSEQLAGHFGTTTLYYPGTKNQIPNNDISSMITADGKAIGNVYRLMSKQGVSFIDSNTASNLTLAPSNPLDFREELLRLDYLLSDKHTIYARWIQDRNTLIDPFGTFAAGGNLPTTPTQRMRPGESFLLAETWVPTSNIINEFRINGSYASQHIPPYGNTWMRSTYGFQFTQLYGGGWFPDGIPQVSITGYNGFQGPNFALMSPSTDLQATDIVSWVHGSHVVKGGFVLIRDRVDQNARSAYTGNISFTPNGNTTGNALADALLGNFRNYQEASADPVGFFRFWQPEAFIQDSWKVNRKLSLEIGLRYQYLQAMYTQANNLGNFVPALFNPSKAVTLNTNGTIVAGSGNPYNGLIREGDGVPTSEQGRVPGSTGALFQTIGAGTPRGLYEPAHLFAPRFGFAYSPMAKTTIRGGFGIFYNRPEGNITFTSLIVPPFLQITQFDNGNLLNPGGGAAGGLPIGSISAISPAFKNAYTEQVSFGVQRELPHALFLETSYVGTLGRRLTRQPNINVPDLPSVAAHPTFSQNYYVPYAGYTTIQQYMSDATSNYHSLQLYVSKRAGNVTFTSGYTWSKILTDGSGLSDNTENYTNIHFSYGPASFDRRHTFSGNFVWELPKLKAQPVIIRQVAGAWQLSGIVRLQTGPYSTVTGNTATGTRRADVISSSITLANPAVSRWFNTTAFVKAPNDRWGTSGVGLVQGPGLSSYDLSIAKNFFMTESLRLRFQSDLFNAFNIANFNTPNVTVTSAAFGQITSSYPARNIQLALRLDF